MANIGKVVASAFSATNENQFSLVNINADFSLLKVEAPIEYQGLGAALSTRRRENAEQGPLHRTARKLGALFEQILPPIKTLAEAYGKRVSEISASEKLKSVGTSKDGPFANHVGFDGTSIYAAATSGHSAIAVHFLACLLARTWPPSEATALWVELVAERKREIETNVDASQIQGMAARVAAQQDIPRADLAKWDASARAWLLSADEVKIWEMTQLRLITKDCGMAVSLRGSTYASVIDVWSVAMTSLQKLILGMPQRISRAALLIGLSAWHIFPDLNVVGPTVHVKFRDPIVGDGGVLTLGLQRSSSENEAGVQWSLSLSHLRYYGDPVKVSTSGDLDSLRITMEDLHMIALGTVLGRWNERLGNIEAAAECLVALRECHDRGSNGKVEEKLPWMDFLCITALRFLNTPSGTERDNHRLLLSYGRRKGRKLLGMEEDLQLPLFGFCGRMLLAGCSRDLSNTSDDQETIIGRLRALAYRHKMTSKHSVIIYPTSNTTSSIFLYSGIAVTTAVPWNDCRGQMHRRWTAGTFEEPRRALYHGEECHFFRSGDVRLIRQAGSFPRLFWGSCPLRGDSLYDADFWFVAGDITKAALFCDRHGIETCGYGDLATYPEATEIFRSEKLCPLMIQDHLRHPERYFPICHIRSVKRMESSLTALLAASALYRDLPGATVSIGVVQIPLYTVKWAELGLNEAEIVDFRAFGCQKYFEWYKDVDKQMLGFPKRAQFACIAMFESGTLDIDPAGLSSVMALSSGNSIFVVDSLLQDPSEQGTSITRLLGNLDRPGIVMLVPPQAPLIRKAELGTWRLVNHYAFDGKVEDSFRETSLHLSFTEYEIPLSVPVGAVDADATMLETLVSAYDRERWIADIDVLGCLTRSHLFACLSGRDSQRTSSTSILEAVKRIKEGASNRKQLISIDCWEELLELPDTLGDSVSVMQLQDRHGGSAIAVIRAAKNWSARLAAMCVCVQKGYLTQVLPTSKTLCMDCDQGLEDMINNTQVFII